MSVVGYFALLLGLIAFCLIRHPKYEDGLIGRVALAGVVLGCLVVVLTEGFTEDVYTMPAEIQLLLAGQVAFMLRHLYRFITWTRRGKYGWTAERRQCERRRAQTATN